jgi:hypothetical protein
LRMLEHIPKKSKQLQISRSIAGSGFEPLVYGL